MPIPRTVLWYKTEKFLAQSRSDFHISNAKLTSYQYGVYYAEIALKPGMKDYLLAHSY